MLKPSAIRASHNGGCAIPVDSFNQDPCPSSQCHAPRFAGSDLPHSPTAALRSTDTEQHSLSSSALRRMLDKHGEVVDQLLDRTWNFPLDQQRRYRNTTPTTYRRISRNLIGIMARKGTAKVKTGCATCKYVTIHQAASLDWLTIAKDPKGQMRRSLATVPEMQEDRSNMRRLPGAPCRLAILGRPASAPAIRDSSLRCR